jgi:branched-subunit amino acid transport protein
MITVYLASGKKCYWLTFLPALFMTMVITTYILVAPEGCRLNYRLSVGIAAVVTVALGAWFLKIQKFNDSKIQ